jgi:DME family drug/metabolite transporter
MHTTMKNPALTGTAMALAAAILWGTTGTAQTFVASQSSPYWTGALRLLIASVFFAVVVLWGRSGPAHGWVWLRTAWHWVLLGGIAMASYNLCFFAGVKATGVAIGTAVAIGSGPIWIGLLQGVLTRQTPQRVWWLGTMLAVTGIGVMLTAAPTGTGFDLTGLMLCLGAGFSYASFTLLSKHLVGVTSPEIATLSVFATASVIAIPVAVLTGGAFAGTSANWLMVGYLGLVATGISYLLFSHALRHVSAATCVTLSLAEPMTAFVLAIVVVGERPGAVAIGGLSLVFAGLLLVVWFETRKGMNGGGRDHPNSSSDT